MTLAFDVLRACSTIWGVHMVFMTPLAAETQALPLEFKAPSAKIETIEAPEIDAAAWRTEHFTLLSDTPIPATVLQRLANTIESVPKVLQALPLPLLGINDKTQANIRFCRDEERFTQFGGPASSAGLYQPRENRILIRADLLLSPQQSRRVRLNGQLEEGLLVHELCHLTTARTLGLAPTWLSEGIAEYLSITHQQGGHYRFDNSPQFIRQHFKMHLGTKDFADLELPSLSQVLALSHRSWAQEIAISDPADRYLPYATSLLFTHYLIEGGQARRQELSKYLTALKEPRSRRQPAPEFNIGNPEEIEARLVRFWSTRGLKLRFRKP
ncbi:hypothetical protein ACFQY0_10540 [Haloferula chungangensis]|uniref:DUF1570 domain-containing protein n=1 Tax=Haloferula chungangensis TaxID=1048331 RepID=A0ABW2L7T4_9BACT